MSSAEEGTDGVGWGLDAAIEALKADLARASEADAGYPRFPITAVTVELKVVASRSKSGKAGFKIPFIQTELGGEMGHSDEVVSTLTLELGAPVDVHGNQVSVSDEADELMR